MTLSFNESQLPHILVNFLSWHSYCVVRIILSICTPFYTFVTKTIIRPNKYLHVTLIIFNIKCVCEREREREGEIYFTSEGCMA